MAFSEEDSFHLGFASRKGYGVKKFKNKNWPLVICEEVADEE